MYQIYADGTLIYDSTLDEYKIGKGLITLETNKSGSFEFSLYPDHFYYDQFVRMKTVIVVYKSGKIVFRGRVLSDVTDYWNNKVITCEGELGFLQDSIIRGFNFTGTPEELFRKFITEHNQQVDDFKNFKIGKVTVTDPNNSITRSNSEYETTLNNLNSRLIEDSLGGYFYVTHENEEETPTLNYLTDFETVSSQAIEFGVNLKNYTKTINAGDIATAIIPLGATVDDKNDKTEDLRLTIASVNDGKDYLFNAEAVALRGWIFKTVVFDDVTVASNLKAKGEEYLQSIVNQAVTIELNAIDLHLLDHDIESFRVGDYIEVLSEPHNFSSTMLCNKQTIDLLKPENDTVTLGHAYSSFTEKASNLSKIPVVQRIANNASNKAESVRQDITTISTGLNELRENVNSNSKKTIVGQASDGSEVTTKPWFKIATVNISELNNDRDIVLMIRRTFGYFPFIGILQCHLRTNNPITSYAGNILWLVNKGFDVNNFVLAIGDDGTTVTAELWAKEDRAWVGLKIDVLSENSRTDEGDYWTLSTSGLTVGGHSEITPGYTQIVSVQ